MRKELNRQPLVELGVRAAFWSLAGVFSLITTTIVALLVAKAVVVLRNTPNLDGLAVVEIVGGIVLPGILTPSLIFVDRFLFVRDSHRLRRRALLWGIPIRVLDIHHCAVNSGCHHWRMGA